MSRAIINIPEGVDHNEAVLTIEALVKTLAMGKRVFVIPVPDQVTNEQMPRIAAAAVAAARVAVVQAMLEQGVAI